MTSGCKPDHADAHADFPLAAASTPRWEPSHVVPCPDDTQVLHQVMVEHFSPSLGEISYALFHQSADADERMNSIVEATGRILGCVDRVVEHKHTLLPDERLAFEHFVLGFQSDVAALQMAALEDHESVVVHWYHHMKQSCTGCHVRFWPPEKARP